MFTSAVFLSDLIDKQIQKEKKRKTLHSLIQLL